MRKNFNATPKIKHNDQRENIFQTKCKIKDKIYDQIIDGGSESNCVSKNLVQALDLETKVRPHPYKLKWLDMLCKEKMFGPVCHRFISRQSAL